MTLEEIKETDWFKERPEIIQQAVERTPPTEWYMFKNSKKQCHIIGYTEPNGEEKECTLIVEKTGLKRESDNTVSTSPLDINQVFGVKVEDLEIWKD